MSQFDGYAIRMSYKRQKYDNFACKMYGMENFENHTLKNYRLTNMRNDGSHSKRI